jgi:hypothetical protein
LITDGKKQRLVEVVVEVVRSDLRMSSEVSEVEDFERSRWIRFEHDLSYVV